MSYALANTTVDKLLTRISEKESKVYTKHFSKNGVLKVEFANGKNLKLPIFKLRPYQREIFRAINVDLIKRFFLVWPRRSGKEVVSWNILVQKAIVDPGLYLMIYPTNVRARFVLWDGAIVLGNGQSLKFIDMIPKIFLSSINQQDMSIKLTNGSVIRVLGSDIDPDKLRGVNSRGVVLSEYAYSDPRVLLILMPVLRQNLGWLILQTTFNGMNHAYRYMQDVKSNPEWLTRVESVVSLVDDAGNRFITDEMIDEDRRSGMPEFLIQQEYYSQVQINQETMWFSRELDALYESKRIMDDLILPGAPVFCFYDIGWNDSTAITLAQFDHLYNPHVIHFIEDKNKTLAHYVTLIRQFAVRHNLTIQSHYVPHDGEKRDINTGKNTVDFGQEMGENFYVVPRPTSKINAIQSMRKLLYRTKFNKQNTVRLIECLSNYSKEYDPKKGIYKDNPVHDWTSHGVDSFQTLALALETNMVHNNETFSIVYMNDH